MKPSKSKSLTENYLYHLGTQIFTVVVPMLTIPYVARVLCSDGIGVYSYTRAVTSCFMIFAALGIPSYGQREIAFVQDDLNHRSILFWELFISKLISSSIVLIMFIVFLLYQSDNQSFYCVHIFLLLSIVCDTSWFFQGIEKFKVLAIRTYIIKLVSLACVFIFVTDRNDLIIYILINSLSIFFIAFHFSRLYERRFLYLQ